MSKKFQLLCEPLTTGLVSMLPPAFAGQGMGVSQPVFHLETRDRERRDRTNAFGRRQTCKNVLENLASPLENVPAIGPGPTLGGIFSGGAANDH